MLRYILLLTILFFCQCGADKINQNPKDTTVIFRTSERNLIFQLTIDNDFTYRDSLLNKDIVLGYPIGVYQKKKKDSSLIHLKINSKDTTFKYPLFQVDSILFGLTATRKFYIITNLDRDAWIID